MLESKEIYIPEVVSRFLKARGFLNSSDQCDFIQASLKNIKSPFLLRGMDLACVRLEKALKAQESIGIYCDYDMDGSSAAAILKKAFSDLGFKYIYIYQPRRLKEGYGFHKAGVDYFEKKKVSLIVTVDVGITSHETTLYAREKNIDVIVTDHHLPDEHLPQALSVINPNTKECKSGLGHLCGAGVAFYLVYGFAKYLKDSDFNIPKIFKLESYLDLLVIGTLTDMVPLIDENRALVKIGLKNFSKTNKAGLIALKTHAELMGKQITSMDIGYKIAPKLNSLSRLDTDLRPTDILMETDFKKAQNLVAEAYNINDKRVEFLDSGLNEALDFFKENPPNNLCYYISDKIHPGVMGLIATRVVDIYGVPAFIGSKLENTLIVGSARLPKKSILSLKEMMGFCPSLLQFGGHKDAAGFELEEKNKEAFKIQLQMYLENFEQKTPNLQQGPSYDCEVYLSELNTDLLNWLKHLEPFGVGFEQPLFKIANLKAASVKKLKNKHYKITVKDKFESSTEILWFSPPLDHEVTKIIESKNFEEKKFNFYVHPQINFFRNRESLQLLLNDVEVL